MQIIPWRNLPTWQQEIDLSGTIYHLVFRWNALNEFWAMDIYDREQTPIVVGIKLVIDYDVTAIYKNNEIFPGAILVIDFSQDLDVIGRLDMGNSVQLIYQDVI